MSVHTKLVSGVAMMGVVLVSPVAVLISGVQECPHLLKVARQHAALRRTLALQAKQEDMIVARLESFLAANATMEQLYLETEFATAADARRGLLALRAAQSQLMTQLRDGRSLP
jgi:hypothetical protein